ncbi:hypothetical protein A3F08_01200 [Candidatus Berkelbacteria bacterium RIFCSPHIGHO2_12_FULL_36_9]|uniref:Nucleoside 2-deoxyribosyltransferase n=1 Tax=Candidatus Berkelbacteria bacterium RIFCSPHIGHO2_12_FULL_36_9 TaxID=1797469 RepID=A0A1F5EGV0_9BACT|nr:MAG: hypothetical protein A3F08_01200 [Candidatus Berkelbacteria bacterium RIFCSPHIGHO2_12_FULL_36_9]
MYEHVFEKIEKRRKTLKINLKFIEFLEKPSSIIKDHLRLAESKLSQSKKIVYIGGSLTHVPPDEKIRYEKSAKLVDKLGGFGYAPHIYGTDPIKHLNVSPQDVRDIDFFWSVLMSDLSIFWCDYPAFGPGIEMAWAEVYNIPSIKIINNKIKLSRLAKGLRDKSKIIEYDSDKDLFKNLKNKLNKILL